MGRKPKRAESVSPADGFETVAAPAGAVSEAQLQPPDERGGCDGPAQPCSGVAALYMHAPAAAWTLAQWVTLLAVVFGICGAWIAAAVAEYASPKTLPGMPPQPRSSAGAAPSPAPPLVRPSSAAGTLCVRYLPGCPVHASDLAAPGVACCGLATPAELLVRSRAACPWMLLAHAR
jgi:hypothetical protein